MNPLFYVVVIRSPDQSIRKFNYIAGILENNFIVMMNDMDVYALRIYVELQNGFCRAELEKAINNTCSTLRK